MVFPNKVDPDDSLLAVASWCLSYHCPFFGSWVPQEASQGAQPGWQAAPTAGGQQWESPLRVCPVAGWERQGILGCQSYISCIPSPKMPGLKAMRTVVKLIERLKVQKTFQVSDWFVRCQIDPGSSAGMWGAVWMSSFWGNTGSRELS